MTIQDALTAGLKGAVTAAVINLFIYIFGSIDPDVLTTAGQAITPGPVLIASFVSVLMGSMVMYVSRKRVDLYKGLATILTLGSLFLPSEALTDPSREMLISLFAMHVVAGVMAMFFVPKWALR